LGIILKQINSVGTVLWVQRLVTSGEGELGSFRNAQSNLRIAADALSSGNMYVHGAVPGGAQATFGEGLSAVVMPQHSKAGALTDAYITKVSTRGTVEWVTLARGVAEDGDESADEAADEDVHLGLTETLDLAVDHKEEVVAVGRFLHKVTPSLSRSHIHALSLSLTHTSILSLTHTCTHLHTCTDRRLESQRPPYPCR
jgi:hypothetical protein